MRVVFIWMSKVIIGISITVTLAKLIFSYFKIEFDITPFVYLISALGVVAFGGKAAQSFSEKGSTTSMDIPQGLSSVITHPIYTGPTVATTTTTATYTPEDNR